jgi:peptidyl-prolyl cis-trans isomerase B (cyclophilin B)
LELSREVPGWQTRTYLLGAALKYSNNKKSISASIKSGFEVAQNIYEKASLLRCLESDVSSYGFVENQTFYAENEMLRTEGLKTLIAMYDSPEFEKYSKRQMTLKGENLNEDFALIFKKAIQNGNTQMVALAAQAIASHSEISEYYMNTFFLNQAVSNCILPRDADTYTVLVDAVKKVNGQTIKPIQASAIDSPDWDYIRSINPGEKIIISTQKGEITLKTDINNAPVAVANFLRLVDEKYFDNSCFTNISTTFLENRGSITGYDENESVMLPTELTERVFDEGTVALITTALNNSVATQWFIMLTSKTILDGTSSVIATVTDGMDCVHALNTGDNIISIRRLKE